MTGTERDTTTNSPACPNCGASDPSERETEQYVLEDGTKRRMTYCTACVREKADGSIRYTVIAEEFVRTELDRTMHDE
ncbi:hypothetical protein MUK72_03040 [Halococcus dombrowskii]|uniref:Small CPxCG-related zinc finger protein n=1 Tax=Halococcus dombrowskii TaxID=179637 RepID=A0AAV3SES5_HALDO|nr:hypothetical protein [Halococcus dombrowskii]UOO95691.1 hypothetical protein MUK72_03040 [Halococcus dombrowskii]